jgi:hypothetical protein
MRKRVIEKLRNNEHAEIRFPNQEKMRELAELVRLREPLVEDVIGFTDGLSIHVECDINNNNAYFNKYHQDTMVNNVFCFSSEGKVIHACINYLGGMHDAMVAVDIVQVVLDNIGKICVDQGFPRSGALYDKFVGPMSKARRRSIAQNLRNWVYTLHNIYVSLRQASEWGMRALQGSFSRLKSRLTSNTEIRGEIILSIILLHNFRTSLVGLNQIATVFNEHYEQYINIEGYDRIARYYERL